MQLIASGLETVPTAEVLNYIKDYIESEDVDAFVVGLPLDLDDSATDATAPVLKFVKKLRSVFPHIEVHMIDERYSSKRAKEVILASGVGKKKRRDKKLVDKVSAALILQDFMESSIWKDS